MYETLKVRVSERRLQSYEAATGGDPVRTLALYDWNLQISAAFFEDLATAEVVLRNAIDQRLRRRYQAVAAAQPWYDQMRLSDAARGKLDNAKQKILISGGQLDQDSVVAELTMGFWRFLLTSTYQSTVWPFVQNAFREQSGAAVARVRVDTKAGTLYGLRNRVAHHEPVFNLNLPARHADLLEFTAWICPDTSAWIAGRSRFHQVLAIRP